MSCRDTLKLPVTEIDDDSDGISIISAQNSDMEDNNRNLDDTDDLKTVFECPKCEECKCQQQQALPLTPPATPFEGDNQLEKVEDNREVAEIEPQIVEQNQLKINYWIVALVVAILAAFMGTKVMGLRQAFELSSKIYEKQIIELKNENSLLMKQLEELRMSLNMQKKHGWDDREYKIPEYCLNVDGSPNDQVVCEQKRRKFDKNLKMQQELRNQKPDLKRKREDFRKQPPQFNKINSDDLRIDLDSIINVEPEPIKSYEEQLQEATDRLFEKLGNKHFLEDEKDDMYSSTVQGDPLPDGINNDEIEKKIQERSSEMKFNAGSQRKFVKIPADQDLDDLEGDIAAGDKELIVEEKDETKTRSQWAIEGDDQELSVENFNSEDFAEWNRKNGKNHENPYIERPQKQKKNRDEGNKDKRDNKNFKKLEEFNRFEEGSGKNKKEEKFRKYEPEKFKENPEKQWKKQDDDKNKKMKFDGNSGSPGEGSKRIKKPKFHDDSDESGESGLKQDKKNRKVENKENQGKQKKFNGSSDTFKRLDENLEKMKKFQQNAARMKKEIKENIRKFDNDAEKFKKFDENSDKFKKSKGDTDKNRKIDETNFNKFEDDSLKQKKPYEKQEKNEKPGKYNESPGKFKKYQKSGDWQQNRMSSREESRMRADKAENWYIERSREREIRRVEVSSTEGNASST